MQLLRGLAYLHTGIYGRSIWADLLSMAQSNETQLMSNRLPRPRPSWMKKKKSGNSCRVKNEKKCERENPSKLFGCCLFEVFFYIHICIYIFFFFAPFKWQLLCTSRWFTRTPATPPQPPIPSDAHSCLTVCGAISF